MNPSYFYSQPVERQLTGNALNHLKRSQQVNLRSWNKAKFDLTIWIIFSTFIDIITFGSGPNAIDIEKAKNHLNTMKKTKSLDIERGKNNLSNIDTLLATAKAMIKPLLKKAKTN